MDIFSELKSLGVANIASQSGLTVVDGKSFGPCPACGAETRHTKRHDKRLACVIVQSGNGWLCLQCDAKGDSVDLAARIANGGARPVGSHEWRRALTSLPSGLSGAFSSVGATNPLPYPRKSQGEAARGLPRPPYAEVQSVWSQADRNPPPSCLDWLSSKFPSYSVEQILKTELVRFIPKSINMKWWPWHHGYMAMLAFDHRGLVQSIHGRMLGEPEEDKPKSRFPKGYSASGLVLSNKTGSSWLRGKCYAEKVIIAEGLTSTLATSVALRNKSKVAVFGYTSGSQSCIKDMPWDNQTVYILTDDDKAGNLYADKILDVLPKSLDVRRGYVR